MCSSIGTRYWLQQMPYTRRKHPNVSKIIIALISRLFLIQAGIASLSSNRLVSDADLWDCSIIIQQSQKALDLFFKSNGHILRQTPIHLRKITTRSLVSYLRYRHALMPHGCPPYQNQTTERHHHWLRQDLWNNSQDFVSQIIPRIDDTWRIVDRHVWPPNKDPNKLKRSVNEQDVVWPEERK